VATITKAVPPAWLAFPCRISAASCSRSCLHRPRAPRSRSPPATTQQLHVRVRGRDVCWRTNVHLRHRHALDAVRVDHRERHAENSARDVQLYDTS
jgi:hypothetical protein